MLNWIAALRRSLTAPPNRRRENRKPVKAPIEVRAASGVTYPGYSRDLSPLGMGAVVSAPLRINEQVWVKYDHPVRGEQCARATVRQATVRQRHGYRYGFEFHVPMDV